jgi:chromosome segregation ATPase
MAEETGTRRALHWDGTVTAGNVLTAATLLFGLVIWGLRLESSVEEAERRIVAVEQANARVSDDARRISEYLARLDERLSALTNATRRVEEAITRQPAR